MVSLGVYDATQKAISFTVNAIKETGGSWVTGFKSLFSGNGFGDLGDAVIQTGATVAVIGKAATDGIGTGLDVFDEIAKFGGAGALVPITGFANAVVSPALDTKAEGWVLGVGAKLFTVAGPVILYGTFASAVYGVLYYIVTAFMG